MTQSNQTNQIVKHAKPMSEMTRSEKLAFKKDIMPILEAVNNLHEIMQVHTIETWKHLRKFKKQNFTLFEWTNWTDEELDNYDRKTGLIGKKGDVSCYVVSLDAAEYEEGKE
ncbi:hypothetical protein KAH94_05020 [bacterium]|nr:hypothetical protein [bacterium]